jgi:sugar lactone lactonase YvrE
MGLTLELDAKAILGESPFWDDKNSALYWVDIIGKKLNSYKPNIKENHSYSFSKLVCNVVKRKNGDLILSLEDGIYSFRQSNNKLHQIVQPDTLGVDNRFNDGKCDPQGRFWSGTMNMNGEKHQGKLYCLNQDGILEQKLDRLSISNGIAWNKELNKMYFIDTPTQKIVSFDFNFKNGEINNIESIFKFSEKDGSPDGMTIDSEGMLWVSLWGGGKVAKIDPLKKKWIDSINVPAKLVTSCVFGGEDLKTLYITTACFGLTEEELEETPHAGGIFSINLNVKGTRSYEYQ